MKRDDVVRILRETAALLELEGENPFRVRAYENAARTFRGLVEEPQDLLERGTLAELPGIGPGMVQAVAEIVHTGRAETHDELRRKYPAGLLDLFRIEGLGPKRIRVLFRELGVDSPSALESACEQGRVAALAGFGTRSQAKILEATRTLGRYRERHLLSEARRAAAELLEHLRGCPAVVRSEVAGALRRWCETVGDIVLVAEVGSGGESEVVSHLRAFTGCQGVESAGDSTVRIRLAGGLQAVLRTVPPERYATTLHQLTGSGEHVAALRELAAASGLTLDESGLSDGHRPLPVADESALYAAVGLDWVAPEMREGLDEIELAGTGSLPELVRSDDLRGTFHVHSSWSDGTASVATMAAAAAAHGWEYLGIADHSRSAAYAGGLSPERVLEQWREIDDWNERGQAPRLFKGTECDILVDGKLDFPDALLVGFDYVVVSVHSRFRIGRAAMTERIVRAVSHPCATFLGHPTGRLLLAREEYELDLAAVLEAAHESGTLVEINASPHRLDLDWRPLRRWLALGCRTSVHPDAHSPQGLADVDYGVGVARKAGARREDLFNCLRTDEVAAYFENRRRRARDLLGLPSG